MLQGKSSLPKDVTLYKQPNATGAFSLRMGTVKINTVAYSMTKSRVHKSGYILEFP